MVETVSSTADVMRFESCAGARTVENKRIAHKAAAGKHSAFFSFQKKKGSSREKNRRHSAAPRVPLRGMAAA